MIKALLGIDIKVEKTIFNFLFKITPFFPRFISEFYNSSIMGILNSLYGFFQNSRTIRLAYKASLSTEVERLTRSCEIKSLQLLQKPFQSGWMMWNCSTTRCDELTKKSWKIKDDQYVVRTIPHPAEMLSKPIRTSPFCPTCTKESPDSLKSGYVSIEYSEGIPHDIEVSGDCPPYLGSSTRQSNALFHQFETYCDIPILKRAFQLRDVIGWFTDPDSKVARGILTNIASMFGEDSAKISETIKHRTGSGEHRFKNPRQSDGGFSAVSHNIPSWIQVISDNLLPVNYRATNYTNPQ